MGNPLVLFNSCLIFVIFQANLTENLRVLLVAMLISHVAFKAGRVDELETESALGLFHLLWKTVQFNISLTISLEPTELSHVGLSRVPLSSSHF